MSSDESLSKGTYRGNGKKQKNAKKIRLLLQGRREGESNELARQRKMSVAVEKVEEISGTTPNLKKKSRKRKSDAQGQGKDAFRRSINAREGKKKRFYNLGE